MTANKRLVVDLLNDLFLPGSTEVKFVLSPGVSMVSNAIVAHFHVKDKTNGDIQAMIKIAPDVGNSERLGGNLISQYLQIPLELEPHGDDFYLYHRIRGCTVDQLVRNKGHRLAGSEHYLNSVLQHMTMWERTVSMNSKVVGYVPKVEATIEKIKQYTLLQNPIKSLLGRRVIINGVELPSIEDSLDKMQQVISSSQVSVMSHGDEGACNVVINREENNQLYYIDHGTAGQRIIEEPLAKILLWFPATLSEKLRFDVNIKQHELIIDYNIGVDSYVKGMVNEAKTMIVGKLGNKIDATLLQACIMMYLFREMQWIGRRGRELMLAPLFAMAMEAAGVMWGALEEASFLAA